ncbi:MAG: hypothetical protein LC687_00055 [Actinobacteria bacterium]|nr:hypothetical protein [Actinomycetota bacterium]
MTTTDRTRKAEHEAYVAAYLAEIARTAEPVILSLRELDRQRMLKATAEFRSTRLALTA